MDVQQIDAARALMRLSAETEIELFSRNSARTPLGMVLYRARRDAIEAMAKLVKVPFTDPDSIRLLQNEVQRYLDMLKFVGDTLAAGDTAMQELEPHEQEEARKLLGLSPGADDE
jgi:hypothetical protein